MNPLTAVDVVTAARRAALALAVDPDVRHYSAGTVATVLRHVVENLYGAGSWDTAEMRVADAIAEDPKLADIDENHLVAIYKACLHQFARALDEVAS